MRLIHKLRTLYHLERADREAILEALVLPVGIAAAFRVLGVPRTQGFLRWWALRSRPAGATADHVVLIRRARRSQRVVRRSAGIEGNCLVRSLTLWTLLLRRGLSTDLRVGFRKRDGRIEGHAWVEFNDQPINEALSETRTFMPYDRPASFDLWRQIGRNGSPG